MPSVDTIASTTVTPAAASGGGAPLLGGAGSSSTSGVFAALMGGVTNGLVTALDAMGTRPNTAASTTTPATIPTSTSSLRRKGAATVADETGASDLAGALAMLVGGALQTATVATDLASAATLGAEAAVRPPATTAPAGPAPTKEPAVAGLPMAAAATTAAATDEAEVADAVAAAVATLLDAEDGTTSDATASQGATSSASSTASSASRPASSATRTAEPNLPPALAAAIARAGGAATPGALRHLTATRDADAASTGSTTMATETTTVAATDGLRGKAATAVADGEVIAAATSATNPAKATEKNTTTVDPARPERAAVTSGETRRVDPSLAASDAGPKTSAPQQNVGDVGEGLGVSVEATNDSVVRDATAFVVAEPREGAAESRLATATQGLETPGPSAAIGAMTEIGRDRGVATVAEASETTASTTRAVPLADVAETIASRSHAGHSRFDIRLAPEELGGVDVRVEVRSSGEVRAHLVVERTETLDLMLRDQRQLERSLADAGLDVGSSGLQFSLKQQPSGEGGQGWRAYDEAHARESRREGSDDETTAVAATAAIAYRNTRVGGVDLRV